MLCPKCKLYTLDFPLEKKKKVCFICMDISDYDVVAQVAKETGNEDLYISDIISGEEIVDDACLHNIQDIIFPQKVWSKMWNYCQLASGEISGFGKVEVQGDKAIVRDIILLRQKCTQSDTIISEDAINEFVYKLAKKGMDTADYRLWWHTHGDSSVFWSPTDEKNITNLQNQFGGVFYSTVINKNGNVLGRVDEDHTNYELNVIIKPHSYSGKLRRKCHKQVRRMVKSVSYQEVEREQISV